MEALKFLKEAERFCDQYKRCADCPIVEKFDGCAFFDAISGTDNLERLVAYIENWSREQHIAPQVDCTWNEPIKKVKFDEVEFIVIAENTDAIKAVMCEYAPSDELAYYMEHGETKDEMIKRIENSVDIVECGFEE